MNFIRGSRIMIFDKNNLNYKYLNDIIDNTIIELEPEDIDEYIKVAYIIQRKLKTSVDDIVVLIVENNTEYIEPGLNFDNQFDIDYAYERLDSGTYLYYFKNESDMNNYCDMSNRESGLDEALNGAIYTIEFDVTDRIDNDDLLRINKIITDAGYHIEGRVISRPYYYGTYTLGEEVDSKSNCDIDDSDSFDEEWTPNINVPIDTVQLNESTTTPITNVNKNIEASPSIGDEDISDADLANALMEI